MDSPIYVVDLVSSMSQVACMQSLAGHSQTLCTGCESRSEVEKDTGGDSHINSQQEVPWCWQEVPWCWPGSCKGGGPEVSAGSDSTSKENNRCEPSYVKTEDEGADGSQRRSSVPEASLHLDLRRKDEFSH